MRLTVACVSILAPLCLPASAVAGFGIKGFTITARNGDGTIDEIAASHPFALDVHIAMNVDSVGEPEGVLREIQIDLPPGLFGNPLSISRCLLTDFESGRCDGSTQIGIMRGVVSGIGQVQVPLYNLVASAAYSATFGGSLNGERFEQHLKLAGSGTSASIRLDGKLPPEPAIVDVEEEIWGVPADPAHDAERICRDGDGKAVEGCSAGAEERALLTLPSSCAEPMRTTLTATSYGTPAEIAVASAVFRDAGGNAEPLIGCDAVPFGPRVEVEAEGGALAPTGFKVEIQLPQDEAVFITPNAPLAGLRIALPSGLALNPSGGSWLTGCPVAAIGLESAPGVEPAVFDEGPAACPAASRLGSLTLLTPLVDHGLSGAIYLAMPSVNPFGARYAIYLVIEDEATGTILKIPGLLETGSTDGRLYVVVPELPWLPFSELALEFAGGPRAPLASPPACGRYSSEATLTPSTAPFDVPAQRSASFALTSGALGTPCPLPEAMRNPHPSFGAGSENPAAGGDAPFVIQLSRQDTDQHFGSFDLTLPPGLVGNLGSIPLGTSVGSVQVHAGVGPAPARLDGTVYLEGPYKSAPYSLRAVVPARVGPFDLGTIVQRAALDVDPVTAQISVHSDPLPQILDGVPLQLRGLRIDLDRPGFIRNPTSCEPMAITGTATTSLGQTAPLSDRFQVGDCAALPFKPKVALRFSGSLRRNGHPVVRTVLRGNADEASIASASFTMPAGELLDLQHVDSLCPQGTAADTCPAGSRLGRLSLTSPFLDGPAEGSVYLVRPSHRLPELLAEVRSGSLRFVLHGRTAIRKGHFSIVLPAIPDIPLSRAVLSLEGGRRGLLVNSRSLCAGLGKAEASLTAHSGKQRTLLVDPRIAHCQPSRHSA